MSTVVPPIPHPSLSALIAFEAVARHRNFRQAAAELGVTPTAVSRTIKTLETQLNVRLFNRTTRSVALTESGTELLESLAPALGSISETIQHIGETIDIPKGVLRINTSYVAYECFIRPIQVRFVEQYPDVTFDVSMDDRLIDIVGSGFDAGIRLGHSVQQDMVALPLGLEQRTIVIASPSYLEKHGTPRTPKELFSHRCIRQRYGTSRRFFEWRFGPRESSFSMQVAGNLVFSEMRSVVEAVEDGLGLGYVYQQFADNALRDGRVVPVLEEHCSRGEAFYLYYPHRSRMPAKLQVFVRAMRDAHAVEPHNKVRG
ncbi:LysR family transcriptional regulator [Caballeronia sp. LZ001]|uniref:LysR family transcriptional regulator n=1 Tax=Caballeronia sp. LZ001 TaxID=3038553 RepID=UPI002867AE65|nr:LysR family transcriptional regulator [Caballeronia sp. LZ001]MDR5804733.1 LysR family transcriptional regulator [Caballeronia sp. LZ001]